MFYRGFAWREPPAEKILEAQCGYCSIIVSTLCSQRQDPGRSSILSIIHKYQHGRKQITRQWPSGPRGERKSGQDGWWRRWGQLQESLGAIQDHSPLHHTGHRSDTITKKQGRTLFLQNNYNYINHSNYMSTITCRDCREGFSTGKVWKSHHLMCD